ncbi:hypothetical protein [Streptomyces tagetis]|nr:hypothetical protein [Streptomyces sp. RG38]
MNPDDAVKVPEGVASAMSNLSREQQNEFARLLATMTHEETDPSRRAFSEKLPDSLGPLEKAV